MTGSGHSLRDGGGGGGGGGGTGNARPTRRAWIASAALGVCPATWLAPGASAASEGSEHTLDELLDAFRTSPGLSARFVEEKHIALLNAPLESAGALYFLPPHKLARHVERPKPSVLLLDGARLRIADKDGSRSMDLSKSPALAALVQSFAQVLRGDRSALEDNYRVELRHEVTEPSGTRWRLRLTPRKQPLDRMVKHLELTGSRLVMTSLTVEEPNGDRTITRFSDVRPRRRFSEEERKRFFRLPGR